ncbi:MAG: AIR synthase family protein [Lachnospiraceae bacterium]|nr:AIR synthase family protein [Lachnospiraceae bacterium]
MKTGKLSESVLKRSVFKRIKVKSPELIISPGVGRDVSAFEAAEDEVIVSATGAFPDVEEDYVYYPLISAVNNLASSGAKPIGVTVTGLLPESMEEAELKALSDEIAGICTKLGIRPLGGHTQVTPVVDRPVITVTALGLAKKEKLLSSSRAEPGDEIVVTKWIGLAGTGILAECREEIISEKFKQELINEAKSFRDLMSVLPEAEIASDYGAHAMHDLSQGGIYNGLWEMSEASGTGLTVDLKKIPVRQETIEICEIFDINPYRLLSAGSMLIAIPDGEGLVNVLSGKGIEATCIGRFTDSNDRIIMNEDEVTYLDSPKPEELLKILIRNGE